MSDPSFPNEFRDPYGTSGTPAGGSGSGRRWLWGLLIGGGLLVLLPCGGCIGLLAYIAAVGPETSVYTGNEVPKRFTDAAREVGALDEGEKILYFYSDALTDVRSGFYFVSDRKVAIFNQHAATPLTRVPFDQIADLELQRDTSFMTDSEIYLTLTDGSPISFPISSELDRDQAFFQAIEAAVQSAGEADQLPGGENQP